MGELITELLTLLSGNNAADEYTVMSTPMEGVELEEERGSGASKLNREAGRDTEVRLGPPELLLELFTLMPAKPKIARMRSSTETTQNKKVLCQCVECNL